MERVANRLDTERDRTMRVSKEGKQIVRNNPECQEQEELSCTTAGLGCSEDGTS